MKPSQKQKFSETPYCQSFLNFSYLSFIKICSIKNQQNTYDSGKYDIIFLIMFSIRPTRPVNAGTRPCRNGPNCYYLKKGTCWFYHPPEHQQSRTSLNSYQRDNDDFLGYSYFRVGQSNQARQREREMQRQRERERRERQRQRERERERQRQREMQRQGLQNLQALRNQMLIRSLHPEVKEVEEKVEAVRETGEIGREGEIMLNLPGLKSRGKWDKDQLWFFERCRHFRMGKRTNKDQYQMCSICLEEFQLASDVTALHCTHSFHTGCIEEWLLKKNFCPICKRDFRDHVHFQKDDPLYKNRMKPGNLPLPIRMPNLLGLPPVVGMMRPPQTRPPIYHYLFTDVNEFEEDSQNVSLDLDDHHDYYDFGHEYDDEYFDEDEFQL